MTPRYLGIDPGQSTGGIAFVSPDGLDVEVVNMPGTEKDILDLLLSYDIAFAWLEKVWARPGQSAGPLFKFGENFGALNMALAALDIRRELVLPSRWQRTIHLTPKSRNETDPQWRNRKKRMAQELFPELKITQRLADAALIAEACRRVHRVPADENGKMLL